MRTWGFLGILYGKGGARLGGKKENEQKNTNREQGTREKREAMSSALHQPSLHCGALPPALSPAVRRKGGREKQQPRAESPLSLVFSLSDTKGDLLGHRADLCNLTDLELPPIKPDLSHPTLRPIRCLSLTYVFPWLSSRTLFFSRPHAVAQRP